MMREYKKTALLFGAGNMGRGLLAPLFIDSGYRVCFVDTNETLIGLLNKAGSYRLKIIGEPPKEYIIKGYQAFHTSQRDEIVDQIALVDLIVISVGANNLKLVAPLLAQGLRLRFGKGIQRPLNILACENMVDGSEVLKGYISKFLSQKTLNNLEQFVGFPSSMISRIVPEPPEPLLVLAEDYIEWTADKFGFRGPIPKIKGLEAVENQPARLERKLYIHNTGHGICGYLGFLKGYSYMHEAIRDTWICETVLGACQESGEALMKKHNFDRLEIREYIEGLLRRIEDPRLPDRVLRVTREPIRKLSPNERLVAPAKLALEYGIAPKNISIGLAAALLFNVPEDPESLRLSKYLKRKGLSWVFKNVCQIQPNSELGRMAKENYKNLKDSQKKCRQS